MAKKILVIDDEPDMVTFLTTLLEDHGYETVTATDGDEGLAQLKAEKPDLVSLDLLMPNKTGIKMFRELRRDPDLANTPVVMVTGFGTDDTPNMDFKKWMKTAGLLYLGYAPNVITNISNVAKNLTLQ